MNDSSFEQTWIIFTQGCFVEGLVEIGLVVLEKFFQILSMYFCYFIIISPWKRVGPFIWTNFNSLHPRKLCTKFGWNWPSGSGEEDENVKSIRQQRQPRQTMDKLWSEKITWPFISGELKCSISIKLSELQLLPVTVLPFLCYDTPQTYIK